MSLHPSSAQPAQAAPGAGRILARPLPLGAVRLTGGPLKRAQDLNGDYLLRLEPDRLLAQFRSSAGLEPKAESYGGWEGGGRQLTGHTLGHYLSGLSLMWSATGDPRFKARVDRLVGALQEIQAAHGDGYLGAMEHGRECFAQVARGDIRSSGFDLNGLWSPWYVVHKLLAGLRDAYRCTGSRAALALELGLAGWAEAVVVGLSEAQMQTMLEAEAGGMGEVLADLQADTGDPRWLALSFRFERHAVLDPLKRHQDQLDGLHGNTLVAELLGSLARFACCGDAGDGYAASFFWDQVVQHHSYATGGHGRDEYFGPADRLDARIDGHTAETCNVYNMIKMARKLFTLHPSGHYPEYQERALYNHILASMDPEDGRTSYMVPVGRGQVHDYQDLFHAFTCCVGSGMESHALHGDGLYYEAGDRLWVNQYVPSTAQWAAAGLALRLETTLPEGDSARLSLTLGTPRRFTLVLRRPAWALDGFAVQVNDQAVADLPGPGGQVQVTRTWRSGDQVALVLPKTLRVEPLADNPRRVALLWGPLVLAADLGPEAGFEPWKPGAIPVLVAAGRPPAEWLRPVPGAPGHFRSVGVGRERDVDLLPFFRLHRRAYAVYFDQFTAQEWASRSLEYQAERQRQQDLAAATVGFVQPGEMQPERDCNFQGEACAPDLVAGRHCRAGQGWFSFDLAVDPERPMAVVATYCQDEWRHHQDDWRQRTFDILVDGHKVAEQVLERGGTPHFFDVTYPLPAALVRGKRQVTVRFQATGGNEIGAVFGVRTIRSGPADAV